MREADRAELIQCLLHETTTARTGPDEAALSAVAVLVVAALLASSGDLLEVALGFATTTADRQFVTIAATFLAADHDRVDALARDHLADHPARPVLTWIVARSHEAGPPEGGAAS